MTFVIAIILMVTLITAQGCVGPHRQSAPSLATKGEKTSGVETQGYLLLVTDTKDARNQTQDVGSIGLSPIRFPAEQLTAQFTRQLLSALATKGIKTQGVPPLKSDASEGEIAQLLKTFSANQAFELKLQRFQVNCLDLMVEPVSLEATVEVTLYSQIGRPVYMHQFSTQVKEKIGLDIDAGIQILLRDAASQIIENCLNDHLLEDAIKKAKDSPLHTAQK
jgi:hypothetical protein